MTPPEKPNINMLPESDRQVASLRSDQKAPPHLIGDASERYVKNHSGTEHQHEHPEEPLAITFESLNEAAGRPTTALEKVKVSMLALNDLSLPELAEKYFGHSATEADGKPRKQTQAEVLVTVVEHFKRWMDHEGLGALVLNGIPHLFSGTHWTPLHDQSCSSLLGDLALQLGHHAIESRHFLFREKLMKQFYSVFHPLDADVESDHVLINFRNGTLDIGKHKEILRGFNKTDLLTYQLPFDYDEEATCPLFDRYLQRVLPDRSSQEVLSEFLGWVFMRNLKLEKVLLLYGEGQNGKSVIFDITNKLLGEQNITNLGLSSLSKTENRWRLGQSLLNFGSEIKNGCDADLFKKLASGEPVEARKLYSDVVIMRRYAKLAFNANILPKDTEQSTGFFRRFLIVPFNQTITEEEKDPDLAQKIIGSELPGIFNWVMQGLRRLRENRKFTECHAAKAALDTYKKESDSVAMFLDEDGLVRSQDRIGKDELYGNYRNYCQGSGYHPVSKVNFGRRLTSAHGVLDSKSGSVRYWHLRRIDN